MCSDSAIREGPAFACKENQTARSVSAKSSRKPREILFYSMKFKADWLQSKAPDAE
jgi:hypothetical protein